MLLRKRYFFFDWFIDWVLLKVVWATTNWFVIPVFIFLQCQRQKAFQVRQRWTVRSDKQVDRQKRGCRPNNGFWHRSSTSVVRKVFDPRWNIQINRCWSERFLHSPYHTCQNLQFFHKTITSKSTWLKKKPGMSENMY